MIVALGNTLILFVDLFNDLKLCIQDIMAMIDRILASISASGICYLSITTYNNLVIGREGFSGSPLTVASIDIYGLSAQTLVNNSSASANW